MAYKREYTASEILRKQFKGQKNFMTPYKLQVGKINRDVAFELSQGKSIFGSSDDLYGVSVVALNRRKGETRGLHDLSSAFSSRNEAEAHINKLKRKLKQNRGRK